MPSLALLTCEYSACVGQRDMYYIQFVYLFVDYIMQDFYAWSINNFNIHFNKLSAFYTVNVNCHLQPVLQHFHNVTQWNSDLMSICVYESTNKYIFLRFHTHWNVQYWHFASTKTSLFYVLTTLNKQMCTNPYLWILKHGIYILILFY